jgi:hypothetical protein
MYYLYQYSWLNTETGRSGTSFGYFTSIEVLMAKLESWSHSVCWEYSLTEDDIAHNRKAKRGNLPKDGFGWHGIYRDSYENNKQYTTLS